MGDQGEGMAWWASCCVRPRRSHICRLAHFDEEFCAKFPVSESLPEEGERIESITRSLPNGDIGERIESNAECDEEVGTSHALTIESWLPVGHNARLRPGDRVQITGLQKQTHMNGMFAEIVSHQKETSRWTVSFG